MRRLFAIISAFALLLAASAGHAQTDRKPPEFGSPGWVEVSPLNELDFSYLSGTQPQPLKSKSVLFTGQLDRITPPLFLPPEAVTDLRNMARPSPGVMAGWKRRSGCTAMNTTAMTSDGSTGETIYSLHSLYVPDHNIEKFFAQAGETIYQGTDTPPNIVASFPVTGETNYFVAPDGVSGFVGGQSSDYLIIAATGTTPVIYSGGTTWPQEFLVSHTSGGTSFHEGSELVFNDRRDLKMRLPQHSGSSEYALFGSPNRLQGISLWFDSSEKNFAAAGVSVQEMMNGTWSGVKNLTDGTKDASGTTTWNQDGRISWTPSDNSKPYLLPATKGHYFWYRMTVDAVLTSGTTTNPTVWRVKVHDRMEEIHNLWSKQYEVALACYKTTVTGYVNYSGNVADGTTARYADVGGLSSSQSLILGFAYPAMGIFLQIDDGYENQQEGLDLTIETWDAENDDWVAVSGTTHDGTAGDNEKSLNHSGTIQWDASNISEDKRYYAGELIPLYFYRLTWSGDLPDDIRIWGVAQVQKPGYDPDPFHEYEWCADFNGRVIWGPGKDFKHGIDYSEQRRPWVMNGPSAGSTGDIFGPGKPVGGVPIGSYFLLGTTKPYRLYLLQGKVPGKFDEYMVSGTVGPVGRHAMVILEDAIRAFNSSKTVHCGALLAPDGVYLAERVVIKISDPIADLFDTGSTPYIEPDYAYLSRSWVNKRTKTLHFSVPLNMENTDFTQTWLNYEIVWSYSTGEWWGIYDRGDYSAQCALTFTGSNDQALSYIGTRNGHVLRTDYGNTDFGNIINHWLKTPDIMPLDALNFKSKLRAVKIKARARDVGDIDVKVFADGAESGATPVGGSIVSMINSGYYYAQGRLSCNNEGETFALQLESGVSTAEKNGKGMEVYAVTLDAMPKRETK